MYSFFSQISAWLSEPFGNMAYSSNIALFAALFFGFIGSVAPCQISANIGAITYFGNRQMQEKMFGFELMLYLLGKMLVFSVFGLLFWLFGQSLSQSSIPVFVYARKMVGPILILIGVFMLGWFRFSGFGHRISGFVQAFSLRVGGKSGAFLMGVAFSLGFCPTMFSVFFGGVMPLAIQSGYGFLLPPVFAVGTAMPLLLFAGLAVGFGLDRRMIKRAKTWGKRVQIGAAVLFILLGISDTLTYWTL